MDCNKRHVICGYKLKVTFMAKKIGHNNPWGKVPYQPQSIKRKGGFKHAFARTLVKLEDMQLNVSKKCFDFCRSLFKMLDLRKKKTCEPLEIHLTRHSNALFGASKKEIQHVLNTLKTLQLIKNMCSVDKSKVLLAKKIALLYQYQESLLKDQEVILNDYVNFLQIRDELPELSERILLFLLHDIGLIERYLTVLPPLPNNYRCLKRLKDALKNSSSVDVCNLVTKKYFLDYQHMRNKVIASSSVTKAKKQH